MSDAEAKSGKYELADVLSVVESLRQYKGWTRGELAENSGLTDSVISRVFKGACSNAFAWQCISKMVPKLDCSSIEEMVQKSENMPHYDMAYFSRCTRVMRESLGLHMTELARNAQLTPYDIDKFEEEARLPAEKANRIPAGLGCESWLEVVTKAAPLLRAQMAKNAYQTNAPESASVSQGMRQASSRKRFTKPDAVIAEDKDAGSAYIPPFDLHANHGNSHAPSAALKPGHKHSWAASYLQSRGHNKLAKG